MMNRVVALLLSVVATVAIGCGGGGPAATETLQDMEFLAFVDDDGDGRCCNEEPRTVRLSDFLAASRPGTRVLMINAAAGWCVPCMREAGEMPEFAAEYGPRGVAIVTAIFQDQNAMPADRAFAQTWAEAFSLTVPTLIDTSFQMDLYVDASVMPINLFVDAETSEILTIATGAETGDDPMRKYRDFLDDYLQ